MDPRVRMAIRAITCKESRVVFAALAKHGFIHKDLIRWILSVRRLVLLWGPLVLLLVVQVDLLDLSPQIDSYARAVAAVLIALGINLPSKK